MDDQRIWQTVLATMLIPLALIAFWPAPVDQPIQGLLVEVLEFLHRRGIPHWLDYKFVEASANVALFVPLGLVAVLAFPEKHWWQIGAFGLLIAGCIELGQLFFLHNRFASPLDLVTNLFGTLAGTQLAAVAVDTLKARHLPAADPQSGGE